MVIVSMCTIQERKGIFRKVINRILHEQTYPVKQIHIWLNGYTEIPTDFPNDSKILYHIEPSNPGPWIRYQAQLYISDSDILATMDDDLIYPNNYIETGVKKLLSLGYNKSVTFGGVLWSNVVPYTHLHYSKHKRLINFSSFLKSDKRVNVIMGGVAFHYASSLHGMLPITNPAFTTNDDLMVSYHLQKRGIEIISAAKPENWIAESELQNAAHALWRRDRNTRESLFKELILKHEFSPNPPDEKPLHNRSILYVTDIAISHEQSLKLENTYSDQYNLYTLELLSQGFSKAIARPLREHKEYFVECLNESGRFTFIPLIKKWRKKKVRKINKFTVDEYLNWLTKEVSFEKIVIGQVCLELKEIVIDYFGKHNTSIPISIDIN